MHGPGSLGPWVVVGTVALGALSAGVQSEHRNIRLEGSVSVS